MWKDGDDTEYTGYEQPAAEEKPAAEAAGKASPFRKILTGTVLPAALTLIFFAIPLFSKTPVYSLNDDIQIRDILSGAYSGSPDLHTVYMGAALSGVLALLYTILPFIPWFGLFLCAAPAAVFLVISLRLMRSSKAALIKGMVFAMLTGLFLWFLYPMYIMPHYTLVAAVFAAGGLWLMIDREHMGGLILLLICQQVRQQVFFMLLPFAAAVLLLGFLEDKDKRDELKKPLIIFVAALVLLSGINIIAYAGSEWRDYLELNDARTALYDYTGVWESDAAMARYAECGVSEEDHELYLQYDLLPVKGADTATLKAMADYREEGRQPTGMAHLKSVIYELGSLFLLSRGKDMVYAMGLLLMYALAVSNSLYRGKGWGALFAAGCFVMHLMLYGYLIWRGRVPERVTVSLCMAECFMLGGLVLRYTEVWRQMYWAIEGAVLTLVVSQALNAMAGISETYSAQITVNNEDDVLYSYMADYPDVLFVAETYATVYHTAYVSETDDTGNCIIMGGWQYLSPLQDKKLKAFGYAGRSEIFEKGGARLVFKKDTGLSPERADRYLRAVYGRGLRLEKELPGGLDIYILE